MFIDGCQWGGGGGHSIGRKFSKVVYVVIELLICYYFVLRTSPARLPEVKYVKLIGALYYINKAVLQNYEYMLFDKRYITGANKYKFKAKVFSSLEISLQTNTLTVLKLYVGPLIKVSIQTKYFQPM